MLLVTGGAGFIGSNVVADLDTRVDLAVCDVLGSDDKWRNLAKRRIADFVPPRELSRWLSGRKLEGVVHMGAISATTATDGDLVLDTNFRLSLELLDWCTKTRTPFVYASSAATYGDGSLGFKDDWTVSALRALRPMNLYGWSKNLFDLVVAQRAERREELPPLWAGLKFFNVFGANEYHKGSMRSVLARFFDDLASGKRVRLFKSHRPGIEHGDQRRDFVYVEDAVRVVRWFLDATPASGIYNVGTGRARSFRDLIGAAYSALGSSPNIEYVDMPEGLRDSYQYFTQADLRNLREAGYQHEFTSLERAVADYVTRFLNTSDKYR
ncbi:MAG: ADP-glyceromanno-heptose 6-epimerase [Deltaproteobacteria bacterium]|nr:ADP-glyceromanno-heptose 6-epimerase [Deltaproteobacteria bacterium]